MSARPDPRLAEVLRFLDPPTGLGPWHGGPTILGCLRGVAAEAARWRPAPSRRSIWELALHVAYWKYAVRRRLTGEPAGSFPRAPADWPAASAGRPIAAWKADRALLRSEHRRLVDAVRSLDPEGLDEPAGKSKKYRVADLLFGSVAHDLHHIGQMQLLKRLYEESSSQSGRRP